jgi:hypothetical protein
MMKLRANPMVKRSGDYDIFYGIGSARAAYVEQ